MKNRILIPLLFMVTLASAQLTSNYNYIQKHGEEEVYPVTSTFKVYDNMNIYFMLNGVPNYLEYLSHDVIDVDGIQAVRITAVTDRGERYLFIFSDEIDILVVKRLQNGTVNILFN